MINVISVSEEKRVGQEDDNIGDLTEREEGKKAVNKILVDLGVTPINLCER